MDSYEHLKVDDEPLSEPEQFVLEQIKKGRIANLKEKFGEEEENRQIRAKFLEELLTGNFDEIKVHRRGVRLSHAVITGNLDLEQAEISYDVAIIDSHFRSGASFRDACFKKHLQLSRTAFAKNADFHRFIVAKNFFCRNAVFQGPVNFGGADIRGQFNADGAKFENKEHQANFNGMQVGQDAFFDKAEFHGPVDFVGADIRRQFNANGAKFENQKEEANFNSMQVGQGVFFKKAEFQGPVDFGGADIRGQFSANGVKFENKEHKASFNHMKVGQSAFFEKTEFQGPVDFVTVDIRRQFNANGAKFENPKEEANFNSMKVGQSVFFNKAEFQGPVDFGNADIRRQFNANGAKFENQKEEANFNSMQVGQGVFFKKAEFQGPVDFGGADIRGQFNANGAKFVNAEHKANFNGMQVRDIFFLDGAIFKGGVSLADALVMDLMLRDLLEPIPALSIERTVVERELALARVQIDSLSASNLEVKVKCSLAQVAIKADCDLRDSKFQVLNLHGVMWPDNPQKVLQDGLTYDAVSAGEGQDDWKKLLAWLKGSRFNTKNYSQLEAYWQRCGHRIRADQTYVAGKKRELKSRKWGLNKIATLLLWDWLTGFGRKPGRIFGVALAFIVIGACLFTPPYLNGSGWMTGTDFYKAAVAGYHPAGKDNAPKPSGPEQQNHGPIKTNSGDSIIPPGAGALGPCERILANFTLRGIISLDRFLPSWVDLGVAKVWEAKDIPWWTIFYWNFHRVCGWVLVVLGLAALSMRFK